VFAGETKGSGRSDQESSMLKMLLTVLVVGVMAMLAEGTMGVAQAKDMTLIAPVGAGGIGKAKAVYTEKSSNKGLIRTFKAEIEKGKPGAVYEIRVNGVLVKKITVNNLGIGKVEIRNITDDPAKKGNPPVVKVGDKVTIGPASGTFALKK
jgi:hypothetical protein